MKYNIVTIEREYASGGREIGHRAAKALEIPCYNQEILKRAAEKRGVSAEYLEEMEERPTNSFFYSVYMLSQSVGGKEVGLTGSEALSLAEGEVIAAMASQGPCVLIGRCASHFLRNRKDVLNVFIHCAWEDRKKRAIEDYGITPAEAENILKKFDKRRAVYYNANTGKKWSDPDGYHIILDSGKLGIESCAAIIKNILA